MNQRGSHCHQNTFCPFRSSYENINEENVGLRPKKRKLLFERILSYYLHGCVQLMTRKNWCQEIENWNLNKSDSCCGRVHICDKIPFFLIQRILIGTQIVSRRSRTFSGIAKEMVFWGYVLNGEHAVNISTIWGIQWNVEFTHKFP